MKEALLRDDVDYMLGQALEQTQAGPDILDVSVGLPEIDEAAMMVKVVKALQGVTDAPLQLDSTDPAVLEQALRVYCGKAIVNSVNGEDGVLDAILPLVKKYGAAVVGLTLDLPVTERLEGTLVTTVMGVLKGCAFVRVHDVKENVRAIRMARAILEERKPDSD